jgi:hypothetical protein
VSNARDRYESIRESVDQIKLALYNIHDQTKNSNIGESTWFTNENPFNIEERLDITVLANKVEQWAWNLADDTPEEHDLCPVCYYITENCECWLCGICKVTNPTDAARCTHCKGYREICDANQPPQPQLIDRLREVLKKETNRNAPKIKVHRHQFMNDLAEAIQLIETHSLNEPDPNE